MKFLVDRCAGHRLAQWLRDEGHDVVESAERGEELGEQATALGDGAIVTVRGDRVRVSLRDEKS